MTGPIKPLYSPHHETKVSPPTTTQRKTKTMSTTIIAIPNLSNVECSDKLTVVVNDILVRLEDDGCPVTIISCRCPHTGDYEEFTYPSEYFDSYRFDDKWGDIMPNKFASIAEGVAVDFVNSREGA